VTAVRGGAERCSTGSRATSRDRIKGMRIAVIGASGWLGGAVAREAVGRGHEVTAIGRDPEKLAALEGTAPVRADATDVESIAEAIGDHDAVVLAVTDRSGPDRSTIPRAAQAVIAALSRAEVPRLAMIGGGGSLLNENGQRFVDQDDFPPEYRAEALAGAEALELLRATPEEVDWTYLSPPPENLTPGDARGGYAVRGDDHPVTDDAGHTAISSGDLAAALVDELEHRQFTRRRFTVGYSS
jgi:putative NADH-flavin reductase